MKYTMKIMTTKTTLKVKKKNLNKTDRSLLNDKWKTGFKKVKCGLTYHDLNTFVIEFM